MNDKQRIAELERRLEIEQPKHVDLIRINGVSQEITGDYRTEIGYIKNGWNKVNGKWIKMNPVPLLEVVERKND